MPSDGPCMRFNNAAQLAFGGVLRPITISWQTNDSQAPWSAEARLIGYDEQNTSIVLRVGHASASKKKEAKALAATAAYQWLVAQYPSIDFTDV